MNPYPLTSTIRKSRSIVRAAACVFASLFLAQVAWGEGAPKVPDVKADAALAATVPKFYRDRGTLLAGVNPDVVPIKFVDDDGNIAGFTPDLLSAAAAVLNLKLELVQSSFDALIPGLRSEEHTSELQ